MSSALSLVSRLFNRHPVPGDESTQPMDTMPSLLQKTNRRDLLRVVLGDTLQRHGIPPDWIGAELLTSTLVNGQDGLHWRLHLKHWDPRLLTYGVALQRALIECLIALDPMASEWLTGISWQFSLTDESACPAMPPPQTWSATLRAPRPHTPEHAVETARADLNKWLTKRDSEFPKQLDTLPPSWAPTQPARR
jgi:hypothetical protein